MPEERKVLQRIVMGEWIAEERKEGVFKVEKEGSNRQFTLNKEGNRRWKNSAVIGGKQRRFRLEARTPEEAIEKSISLFFESKEKEEDPRFIEVEEMFLRWMAVRKLQDTTETDYERYIDYFLDWLRMTFPNLLYWSELRLEHLELYTKFLGSEARTKIRGKGNRNLAKLTSRDSFRLYTHPIRACATWASINWEDAFRDFSRRYVVPEVDREEKPKLHIPLCDAPRLIRHLEEEGKPPEMVAAIALHLVLGMTETEVLRLIWEEHIFLDLAKVQYTARAKNKYRRRYLPLPKIVVEVLSKVPDKTGRLVKGYANYREYSTPVSSWISNWDRKYAKLPVSDLRNTIISTGLYEDWSLILLERFVGHKGDVKSLRREAANLGISLDHYFSSELDFLFVKYQQVILPRIEEHLARSSGSEQNSTEIAQSGDECRKDQEAA